MTEEKQTAGKKTLLVGVVLDESGSMGACWEPTIDGYNEYIKAMRKDQAGVAVHTTLVKFNTKYEVVHAGFDLAKAPLLNKHNYKPGGMTALYDAVAQGIIQLDEMVARHKLASGDEPQVICVVITDGGENSSIEHTLSAIQTMITDRDNLANWTFVYLGTDADTWDVAQSMGVPASNTMQWRHSNTGDAYAGLAKGATVTMAAMASGQPVQSAAYFSAANVSQDDILGNVTTTGETLTDDGQSILNTSKSRKWQNALKKAKE